MRAMRSASEECHDSVDQSMSQITTRPPGRTTRISSASAASTSLRYSKTWTEIARSTDASPTGSFVASPSSRRTFGRSPAFRPAIASIAALASTPVTEPFAPTMSRMSTT